MPNLFYDDIDHATSLYTDGLSSSGDYNYCDQCGCRMDEDGDFCSDDCQDEHLNEEI